MLSHLLLVACWTWLTCAPLAAADASGGLCNDDDLVVLYPAQNCTGGPVGSLRVKNYTGQVCLDAATAGADCWAGDPPVSALIQGGFPRGGEIFLCNSTAACSSDEWIKITVKEAIYPTTEGEPSNDYCLESFVSDLLDNPGAFAPDEVWDEVGVHDTNGTTYEDNIVKVEQLPAAEGKALQGSGARAGACRPAGVAAADDARLVTEDWEFFGCFDNSGEDSMFVRGRGSRRSLGGCAFDATRDYYKHFGLQCPQCWENPAQVECWTVPTIKTAEDVKARWRPLRECGSMPTPLGGNNKVALYRRKGYDSDSWRAGSGQPPYSFHGCFFDPNGARLFTLLSKDFLPVECARAADSHRDGMFGMQFPQGYSVANTSECWYNVDDGMIPGVGGIQRMPTRECVVEYSALGPLGGYHRNALYVRDDWGAPPYRYEGCYEDPNAARMFQHSAKGIDMPTCSRLAYNESSDFFGLQFPQGYDGHLTECWYGLKEGAIPGQGTYRQVPRSECTLEYSPFGPNGGFHLNAVYRFGIQEYSDGSPPTANATVCKEAARPGEPVFVIMADNKVSKLCTLDDIAAANPNTNISTLTSMQSEWSIPESCSCPAVTPTGIPPPTASGVESGPASAATPAALPLLMYLFSSLLAAAAVLAM